MTAHMSGETTVTLPFRASLVAMAAGLLVSGCAVVSGITKSYCPEGFDCVVIQAPLDHLDLDESRTIDVAFAVRPADGPRIGVLVTAVGGPGGSGLESADYEPLTMDPDILDGFDLVYFDQRGLWTFPEPACPHADTAFGEDYLDLPTDDPGRWEQLAILNVEYNQACVAEAGDTHVLSFLGTEQVARDLELFRDLQGYETLTIYGQSYGTAVAQEYASLFPDRVDRLVLDGPLDRTRDSIEFTQDQIGGIEESMRLLFEACDLDELCSADMGRPTAEVYQALVDRLLAEPATVRFPVEPDVFEDWPFIAEDVSYLAFLNSYLDSDRHLYLRALAAANRGEYVSMLRLYSTGDFGLSSMVNAAVTCLDGSIPGDDPVSEVGELTEAREETAPEQRWQYEVALPCVDWPGLDHSAPPESPFSGPGIPTMVIASNADPATPYSQALTLVDQLADPRLLTVNGGSHVMFGRGIACIDDHVTRFILGGEVAANHSCDAPLVDPYIPLIALDGTDDQLFTGIDNELAYLPELYLWDGYALTEVACSLGGKASFTGTDTTTDYLLEDCAFNPDLVVNGKGRWDYNRGRSNLTATIEGDRCSYEFSQRWEEELGSVEATCP